MAKKLNYEYISERMLNAINRQKKGAEDSFILRNFNEHDLKVIERFICSFVFAEEENILKLRNDIENAVDGHWIKKIEGLLS